MAVMKTPLLSVLIPAYNFPHGVARALASIGPLPDLAAGGDLEVLVSDDSSDAALASDIERLAGGCSIASYVHNRPALGAARNWNTLLQRATGRYCVILHHDEWFESPAVLAGVLRRLMHADAPDCIVLPCKIVKTGKAPKPHMPKWLVRTILRRWPGYLFRRNVIGSPSVMVLRRNLYESFDERLQWFVDVELYARVLTTQSPRCVVVDGEGVVSDKSFGSSITKTIKGQLDGIRRSELIVLEEKGALRSHGAWLVGPGHAASAGRSLETLAWSFFRLAWDVRQRLGDIAAKQSAAWRFKV
jgi:glycosyltransferase involved in cell wall biosynthesis